MSKDWFQDIVDFRREMGQYLPKPFRPSLPPEAERDFCLELVKEETKELSDAIQAGDIVKTADGIVDSIVVILGVAVACGTDVRPIWNEVHKTNMAKLGGPIREDGKQLKPVGWKSPDIKGILEKQGG